MCKYNYIWIERNGYYREINNGSTQTICNDLKVLKNLRGLSIEKSSPWGSDYLWIDCGGIRYHNFKDFKDDYANIEEMIAVVEAVTSIGFDTVPHTRTQLLKKEMQVLLKKDYSEFKKITSTKEDIARLTKLKEQSGAVVYVHAEEAENVVALDIKSSYPYILCNREFPMGDWTTSIPNPNRKGCWYGEAVVNIKHCKVDFCKVGGGAKTVWLSNANYQAFTKAYDANIVRWNKFYVCSKSKPLSKRYTNFIKTKFEIKQKAQKGTMEYRLAKIALNSIFGINLVNPNKSGYDQYMASPARTYSHYQVGIWTMHYAQARLVEAIIACDGDVLYSDTDSVYLVNAHEHLDYFNIGNQMGDWCVDGEYKRFKAFKGKTYKKMDYHGNIDFTCAGCNKDAIHEWLADHDWDDLREGVTIRNAGAIFHQDEGRYIYYDYTI